jgi:hypothetical protein
MSKLIATLVQLLLLIACLFRPADAAGTVEEKILQMDAVVFEQGFNNCDIEALTGVIDESLEFYHDQSGITLGKQDFLDTTRNNICSLDYRPRRELIPGTTQVHPLYDNGELYGAIQMGEHRFFARYEDQPEKLTSIASFTHLWTRTDDGWLLSRVLSYAHHNPPDPGAKAAATSRALPDTI